MRSSAVWAGCCICLFVIVGFNACMWGASAQRAYRAEWQVAALRAQLAKTAPEKPVATLIVPVRAIAVGPWLVSRQGKRVTMELGHWQRGNASGSKVFLALDPPHARAAAWALNKMADEVEADLRDTDTREEEDGDG